jgi:hypothetical protein
VLGVLTSTRWAAPRWPRFVVSGLHRNVTLLALAFVCVHVMTTILDGYAPIGLRDAVIPFVSRYRPLWLGFGALAFDLLLAIIATSAARARIGYRTWRIVHWLAYASWPVALVHALEPAATRARVGSACSPWRRCSRSSSPCSGAARGRLGTRIDPVAGGVAGAGRARLIGIWAASGRWHARGLVARERPQPRSPPLPARYR